MYILDKLYEKCVHPHGIGLFFKYLRSFPPIIGIYRVEVDLHEVFSIRLLGQEPDLPFKKLPLVLPHFLKGACYVFE